MLALTPSDLTIEELAKAFLELFKDVDRMAYCHIEECTMVEGNMDPELFDRAESMAKRLGWSEDEGELC